MKKTVIVAGILMILFLLIIHLLLVISRSSGRLQKKNEDFALYNLMLIKTCETAYSKSSYLHSFATLKELCNEQDLIHECTDLDTSVLCLGKKMGYNFYVKIGESDDADQRTWTWSATAWPIVYGEAGRRTFYIDQDDVLRGADIGGIQGDLSLPIIE